MRALATLGAAPRTRASAARLDRVPRRLARRVHGGARHPDHQRSLADIQGTLGASLDEGSWISTGYLIAEIIVIPLTGWLGSVFGLRRYLIANASLFLVFSVLCGTATSLNEMILFRIGQGFTGGVLIPTAFTIMLIRIPAAQRADRGRDVRPDRHLRAGDRPDHRRLADRHLFLALDLLHQPVPRRGADRR